MSSVNQPPGSYSWPIVGETMEWLRDPEEWARKRLERYGNIFRTNVFGKKVFVMVGPEANRFILLSGEENFEWAGGYGAFTGRLFPGSLSMEDGESHDRHRKALTPIFHGSTLESHCQMIVQKVESHVYRWAQKDEIIVFDAMRSLTFEIITQVLLGDIDTAESARLTSLFETLSRGVLTPLRMNLPGTTYSKALRARRDLEKWLRERVQRARSGPENNLPGIVSNSKDNLFTNEEIISHILGLIFDGQDTTASLVTWLLLELERHSKALEQIRGEARDLIEGRDFSLEQVNRLSYLHAAIQEAGRLHHPAPALPRRVIKSFEFNGYYVPEGSLVLYSPAITHRLPEQFDDPDRFDPSRFLPPREEHKREPFGLVVFGGGPRTCLGAAFATLEIKILLATLAAGYSWNMSPDQDLRPVYLPTKRPRSGLRLHFRK